jgi:hypothetical protein
LRIPEITGIRIEKLLAIHQIVARVRHIQPLPHKGDGKGQDEKKEQNRDNLVSGIRHTTIFSRRQSTN